MRRPAGLGRDPNDRAVRWWWYNWGGKQAGRQLHCRRHPPHPSPVGSVHALRQSIQYRARMQQQHDDGRTDGSVAQGRACFALLACMHCARGASTPTAVPSRANQTPLAIMVYFCWSGRGPGAGPHPRTDAPIPCKRRRDRHHWRAYGLSRCGGGTHEQCVAAYCFAIAIPSPIGRCPIACLADLPSAAQSAAEGHMLVGMHAMQCTARRSVQRTHSTIHNRLET